VKHGPGAGDQGKDSALKGPRGGMRGEKEKGTDSKEIPTGRGKNGIIHPKEATMEEVSNLSPT